jgi:hypothetical protein
MKYYNGDIYRNIEYVIAEVEKLARILCDVNPVIRKSLITEAKI